MLFIISRECESFCINNRELRFQIIISFWDACGYIRRLIYSLLRLYSSCRTTLPKLFLSTLKKQSLCAVLSRSCSTSNEQRAPREQSIRLWAAARSTARFLSSVPKSTFRSNCGRFVKGGMGRRLMRRVGTHQPPSGQYPHPDRQTLSSNLIFPKGQSGRSGYGARCTCRCRFLPFAVGGVLIAGALSIAPPLFNLQLSLCAPVLPDHPVLSKQ